ncbi:MAG: FG-GAP repeat protein [Sandaracinaceae bacterium]|nr:FG-GAP repeat protein [Sandaracinaceae bacterium]
MRSRTVKDDSKSARSHESPQPRLELELLWTSRPQLSGYRFGQSMCLVGDADQDGIADIAIGAPRDESASDLVSYSGFVSLVSRPLDCR